MLMMLQESYVVVTKKLLLLPKIHLQELNLYL